jgi:hypothetical protein
MQSCAVPPAKTLSVALEFARISVIHLKHTWMLLLTLKYFGSLAVLK